MADGHIAFLLILSACRLGLRSCQARVWQYRAVLSGWKEMATSGGVPPLMARWMASSSFPWTCLTVIHGYFCLMLSRALVVTLPSRPEKLLQTVSVSGSCWALGSTVAAVLESPPPPAVQAAASSASARRPMSRRRMGHSLPERTVPGWLDFRPRAPSGRAWSRGRSG